MSKYYDRQGKPIGMLDWAKSLESRNPDIRRVAFDTIDGVDVSTVWLGLDYQWGNGPPLIFETMIFGGPHDQAQWRYSTEAEAIAGHAEAVKKVKFNE